MVMAGAVFRLHVGPADSGFVSYGDAEKAAGGNGLAALLEANGEYSVREEGHWLLPASIFVLLCHLWAH